jgi:hypothetical protein
MLGLVSVFLLLASETPRCPWHCPETFGADLFLTIEALAKLALFNAGERTANFPQDARSAFQIASPQFAFGGDVHFVKRVWSFLDGDAFALRELRHELAQFRIQNRFVIGDFTLTHLRAL